MEVLWNEPRCVRQSVALSRILNEEKFIIGMGAAYGTEHRLLGSTSPDARQISLTHGREASLAKRCSCRSQTAHIPRPPMAPVTRLGLYSGSIEGVRVPEGVDRESIRQTK
jgi:hypothetical protein